MSQSGKIVPVILSGGGGTRLWPLSTPACPKQFLALTAHETMFQLTALRTASQDQFERPIIVANAAHAGLVTRQLADIGIQPDAIILEPCARNTAPAIALAALSVPVPDAVMLVMPSDHVITDLPAFRHVLDAALGHARDGWLVTFGIRPTHGETGYGYIRIGPELRAGLHRVDQFIEKPDAENAHIMFSDGNHAWNGGIFLFRADIYLERLGVFAPDILQAAERASALASREGALIFPDSESFASSPSDSIDYAIMEKADRVAVAPVAMGWSDVGSWDALYDIGTKDRDGNLLTGDILATDATGNLIQSDGPAISVSGVNDLIIVAAGSHILIVPRGQAQDVKKIVVERGS